MSKRSDIEVVETYMLVATKLTKKEQALRQKIDNSWKHAVQRNNAALHKNAAGRKIVRELNMAGPCIWLGTITRETAMFYIFDAYAPHHGTRKRKDNVHIDPCKRCTDHPNTHYPMGLID